MVLIDGQPQEQFPTIKASTADIMERMQRLCAPIPETVELGIHLCYGDFGAKHFIEPIDASRMVEAAKRAGALNQAPAGLHPHAGPHEPDGRCVLQSAA